MTTKTEIETRARKIVAEHLDQPLEKITSGADFIDTLGADSLDFVELTMAFEVEFDIEIPDDKAEEIKTFGSAVDFIAAQLEVTA